MKSVTLLSILALMVFFIHGCSKDNNSENYIRGVIDGQPFECSSNIGANKPEPITGLGSDPTVRITGDWPSNSLKLMLLSEADLTAGTYVFAAGLQRSATLVEGNMLIYYAGSEGFFSTGDLRGSGKIIITEISRKHVKGSFEFVAEEIPLGNSKTVTNGEFSVTRN